MSTRRLVRRRGVALAAAGAAFAVVLSACSSSSNSSTGSTNKTPGPTTLHLAFESDMGQPPDPDIFYEIEGNAVVTSVYEGLVRYKPDSNQIEPALATSWDTSPDGMTYTFHLRNGVTFHDGTPMDSAAVKTSFMRRTAVNSAPAYMLGDVDHYETPDPSTFVVKLKDPVNPFLDYLAAPYGPKVQSPAVLSAHAGTDNAQSWLKDHDAGTGPFTITSFAPGQKYTLTRFDPYWGGKPYLAEIDIAIVPDISTQRLELEGGQLDMILHGLSTEDVNALKGNTKFEIHQYPANLKTLLFVNENKGVFKDPTVRGALRSAIDKQAIVNSVYGSRATVSNQTIPAGELPVGTAVDTPAFDPSKLAAAVKSLPDKKVDLAYDTQDATNQRVANLIQTQMQAAGLNVTVRGVTFSQAQDLPNHPDQAPDALLDSTNPDASHPDTWVRIYNHTNNGTDGALNYLKCSVPAADAAMDKGVHATSNADMQSLYGQAGSLIADSGCFDTIADVKETVVARTGYTTYVHQLPTLFTIRFGDLTAVS